MLPWRSIDVRTRIQQDLDHLKVSDVRCFLERSHSPTISPLIIINAGSTLQKRFGEVNIPVTNRHFERSIFELGLAVNNLSGIQQEMHKVVITTSYSM